MAEKKTTQKSYDRWDKTCVKVVKKPTKKTKRGK